MVFCGLCVSSKELNIECTCFCHKEPVEFNHHVIDSFIFTGKVKDEGPPPKRLDILMKEQGLID